jgi:hypothetical protein
MVQLVVCLAARDCSSGIPASGAAVLTPARLTTHRTVVAVNH